jgi:hypothetical protein
MFWALLFLDLSSALLVDPSSAAVAEDVAIYRRALADFAMQPDRVVEDVVVSAACQDFARRALDDQLAESYRRRNRGRTRLSSLVPLIQIETAYLMNRLEETLAFSAIGWNRDVALLQLESDGGSARTPAGWCLLYDRHSGKLRSALRIPEGSLRTWPR